jgi:hypothetical protein
MQGPLELKKTINLPKTSISMKANLPQNEPKWLVRWSKEEFVSRAEARRFSPRMTARLVPKTFTSFLLTSAAEHANLLVRLG